VTGWALCSVGASLLPLLRQSSQTPPSAPHGRLDSLLRPIFLLPLPPLAANPPVASRTLSNLPPPSTCYDGPATFLHSTPFLLALALARPRPRSPLLFSLLFPLTPPYSYHRSIDHTPATRRPVVVVQSRAVPFSHASLFSGFLFGESRPGGTETNLPTMPLSPSRDFLLGYVLSRASPRKHFLHPVQQLSNLN